MQSYKTLEKIYQRLAYLGQVKSVLHWDMAVTMPAGAIESRSEQLATLDSLYHAVLNDKGIGALLKEALKEKGLNAWQKANVRCMQRFYDDVAAVPASLSSRLVKEGAVCEMAWRSARKENDFKAYSKPLKRVVDLVREIAAAKADYLQCDPYDALLDKYDPGSTQKELDPIFDDLAQFLPDFIPQVIEAQKKHKTVPLKGTFPIDKQKEVAAHLLDVVGFDKQYGRFDESIHPFCGGYPSDIRITTRYNEDDFMSAFMAVMHEAGHAMYEQGLPVDWRVQPVGQAMGIAVHESQSLFVEMQLCRSEQFISYLLPFAKKAFNAKGKEWSVKNLYGLVTQVAPSFIRVEADEVTYPAHILIRYAIEKYLINGEMEVDDLPEAWAQGMKKYLGVVPKDDASGCMQDIHWADGTFGYFPCYTLGAMIAAQLFSSYEKSNKKGLASLKKGDFSSMRKWLGEQIHCNGSLLQRNDLLQHVTGKALDVSFFKEHLKARYLN